MIWIFITLLTISQIYLFYKIDYKPTNEIEKDCIILKPIPESIKIDDVEGFDVISDILITAKSECWDYSINKSDNLYEVNIKSSDIEILAALWFDEAFDEKVSLPRFHIKNREVSGQIRFLNVKDTVLDNDLILFLWDYIIEWENNKNTEEYNNYKEIFLGIRKNLKSLNRDRKLNDLFE